MPSWVGLATTTPASHSTSTSNHHHELNNSSNSSIDQAAAVKDSGFTDSAAHVRNNINNGESIMNGYSNNSNGIHKSNAITMPWSSSLKGKGKAIQEPSSSSYSVTGAEAFHQNDNGGRNDIPHSTAEFDSQEEEEDSDSLTQLDTEEVEALLWDAQMALIAHQYQTAVSLLEKAAKGGSSTACLSLANIYHKGLPCSTHPHSHTHHKKHTISPSKLIEGSISTDQVKTASYLLQALELEAAKSQYDDLDLEVLSDASLLLCNMFRYGKIRPRDPSRTTGPMRELSISSSELKKSNSFLNPIIDDSILVEPNESAWVRGGRLAKVLTEKIKTALEKKGVTWSEESESDNIMEGHDVVSSSTNGSLQDADVERLDTILVCLYYIIALVSGSREGPEAIQESIRYWKLLLASHGVFSSLYMSRSKTKSNKNGHPPTRQSSRSTPKLDDLVSKAEKRLHLLTTALEESKKQPGNRSSIRPRDIILRRDTSEYSASLLFSPTSDSSMNFGSSSHTDSPKRDSPNSRMDASQQSIDTACSCELPIPPSPRRRSGLSAPDKTPQKRRAAKFAIHDSPASMMSAAPPMKASHSAAPTSRQKTVPPALFRGFQNQSRLNLRQSLTAQSTSSSHLSLADLASSASSIAPTSTYRRPGDLRRPLLDRKASQVSLASTTAFGRRAWTGTTAQPLSRVSNLSSASLHTLAPTTDRHMSESGVLSLPHNSTKSQSVNATQVLSSLRASTSAAQPGLSSNYTGSRFRNVVSSLGSFFTSASVNDSTSDASKAKKELEKVAEQHDAEVENFYSWEDDRTSSEEESLHSGSPSNKGDDESVIEDVETSHRDTEEEAMRTQEQVTPAPLSASRGRQPRNMDGGNPQRPVYPLSTSISSSYLHASSPTASPRRGGMPTFPTATAPTKTPTKDTRPNRTEANGLLSSETPIDGLPRRFTKHDSPFKPTKIDPLLAALEAASRVNVKSRCSVCGIQGVNFPACQKCGITFCSRDCRVASGGDAGRHVCQTDTSQLPVPPTTTS